MTKGKGEAGKKPNESGVDGITKAYNLVEAVKKGA
jgi:hypothetical protein